MKKVCGNKYLMIICGIIFHSTIVFSQVSSAKIDSLQKRMTSCVGKQRASVQIELAKCYFDNSNKIEEAKDMSEAALQTSSALNDSALIAYSWRLLGHYHRVKFQNDKAIDCFLKSLSFCEKFGDKEQLNYLDNNIGLIYLDTRNYEKARVYFNSSLELCKQLNKPEKVASVLLNIGSIYYYQDSSQKALEYFQESYEIYNKLGNKKNATLLQNNIAGVYNDLKQYNKSLETYKLALQSYEELKDTSGIATCLGNIGNIYNALNNPKEGISYTEKSLIIAQKIGDRQLEAGAYNFLYEGYEKMGDYKNAYLFTEKLLKLKDTIYDAQSNQNIAEMQTRYDSEKKEKENQILKKDVEIKQLTNTRQKFIIYGVMFGLILLLILTFFIYKSFKQKQKANIELAEKNEIIESKNKIVEEKNKDIIDSIRYAKRLQSAILKPENNINNCFSDGFVLFKPKDIVSGDFYWFEKFGDLSLVAAADCTGHGVPGAFMSIIGCNLLSQAINEYAITKPAAILNSVNKGLAKVLQQKSDGLSVKDGMDIALCVFDSERMIVEYSGAYNPMWIVRQGELIEYKADKFPVGAFVDNKTYIFTNHEIPVQKNDMIYIFSDGYADQFGGEQGKKFKYKQLQNLFLDNYTKPASEQKNIMEHVFESWMGDLEQVDDVLIIGVKI